MYLSLGMVQNGIWEFSSKYKNEHAYIHRCINTYLFMYLFIVLCSLLLY